MVQAMRLTGAATAPDTCAHSPLYWHMNKIWYGLVVLVPEDAKLAVAKGQGLTGDSSEAGA